MTRKPIFYEVNPRYFKDFKGNGIGDLKGMEEKLNYFSDLSIDYLILSSALSTDTYDKIQDFTKVSSDIGTIKELKVIIAKLKQKNIKVIIELNIGSIHKNHKWFKNAQISKNDSIVKFEKNTNDEIPDHLEYKYSKAAQAYYIIETATQEIPLNWNSNLTIERFKKVIEFWNSLDVGGFVFNNFENVMSGNNGEIMGNKSITQLKKIYRLTKSIDDKLIVIGKSNKMHLKNMKEHTSGINIIFDYFTTSFFSLIGTHEKYGNDLIGSFKSFDLSKQIKRFINDSTQILSFGSDLSGRVISRWGDDNHFNVETAKTIAILQFACPSSISIYFGEELGMKNLGLTPFSDFMDNDLLARKRILEADGILNEKFMDAQILQNKVNSRNMMQWDSSINAGFSIAKKTIAPPSDSYEYINVEKEETNKYSVLNFYKKLINLNQEDKYSKIFLNGSFNISIKNSSKKGIIKIVRTYKSTKLIFLINLSPNVNKIHHHFKKAVILLSSYSSKIYSTSLNSLQPFESIILEQNIKTKKELKSKLNKKQTNVFDKEFESTQEMSTMDEIELGKTQQIDLSKLQQINNKDLLINEQTNLNTREINKKDILNKDKNK